MNRLQVHCPGFISWAAPATTIRTTVPSNAYLHFAFSSLLQALVSSLYLSACPVALTRSPHSGKAKEAFDLTSAKSLGRTPSPLVRRPITPRSLQAEMSPRRLKLSAPLGVFTFRSWQQPCSLLCACNAQHAQATDPFAPPGQAYWETCLQHRHGKSATHACSLVRCSFPPIHQNPQLRLGTFLAATRPEFPTCCSRVSQDCGAARLGRATFRLKLSSIRRLCTQRRCPTLLTEAFYSFQQTFVASRS